VEAVRHIRCTARAAPAVEGIPGSASNGNISRCNGYVKGWCEIPIALAVPRVGALQVYAVVIARLEGPTALPKHTAKEALLCNTTAGT
jgi:hypothetical protein